MDIFWIVKEIDIWFITEERSITRLDTQLCFYILYTDEQHQCC